MPVYRIYSDVLKNLFDFPNLIVPMQPYGEEVSWTDFSEVNKIILAKESEVPGYRFFLDISYNTYKAEPSDSDKPVIVFLHGCLSSQSIFTPLCDKLKERGNDMVTLDFLGHGKSTKLSDIFVPNQSKGVTYTAEEQKKLIAFFYSPMSMVMQVEALLTELKIRGPNGGSKIHLLGWSLGGYIAYGIANLHPDWVALLIPLAAPPVRFSEEGWSTAFTEIMLKSMKEYISTPETIKLEGAIGIASRFGVEEKEMGGRNIDSLFVDNFRRDVIECDKLARLIVFLNVFYSDKITKQYLNGEHCLMRRDAPYMIRLFFGSKDNDILKQYITTLAAKYVDTIDYTHPVEVRNISEARHAVFLHPKTLESLVYSLMFCKIISSRTNGDLEPRKTTKSSPENGSKSWARWLVENRTPIAAVGTVVGVVGCLWLWSRNKDNKFPFGASASALSNVAKPTSPKFG